MSTGNSSYLTYKIITWTNFLVASFLHIITYKPNLFPLLLGWASFRKKESTREALHWVLSEENNKCPWLSPLRFKQPYERTFHGFYLTQHFPKLIHFRNFFCATSPSTIINIPQKQCFKKQLHKNAGINNTLVYDIIIAI